MAKKTTPRSTRSRKTPATKKKPATPAPKEAGAFGSLRDFIWKLLQGAPEEAVMITGLEHGDDLPDNGSNNHTIAGVVRPSRSTQTRRRRFGSPGA